MSSAASLPPLRRIIVAAFVGAALVDSKFNTAPRALASFVPAKGIGEQCSRADQCDQYPFHRFFAYMDCPNGKCCLGAGKKVWNAQYNAKTHCCSGNSVLNQEGNDICT